MAGKAVRRWRGRGTQQLRPVVWDVSDLVGERAVLAAVDEDERPGVWLGSDEIRRYDSGCREPAIDPAAIDPAGD